MPKTFSSAAPTFLVPNVEQTIGWYEEMLGFEVATSMRAHGPGQDDEEDGEHEHTGPVTFAILQRDEVAIMFAAASEPVRPNREARGAPEALDLYVWMADGQSVADLHDHCESRGVSLVQPLSETFYGMVEFALLDCDGRQIVFRADTEA